MSCASTGAFLADKTFTYDGAQRLTAQQDTRTGHTYTNVYRKNKQNAICPEDAVVGVKLLDKYTDEVAEDSFNRPTERKLTLWGASRSLMKDSTKYQSLKLGDGYNRSDILISAFGTEINESNRINQFVYAYDNCGNIENVISQCVDVEYTYDDDGNLVDKDEEVDLQSVSNVAEYAYDTLNRLIYERNYQTNRTFSYQYDACGNITSQTRDGNTVEYKYDSSWKDLLIEFNNQSITYDGMGNPLQYKGNILTWTNVRRLASYGNNTFSYGANGIRYKKNNITYTVDGNKILRETDGTKTLTYYYGLNGVIGFRYNNADYYYRKNLQGDVISIYDANGTYIGGYVYNAWGEILYCTDNEVCNANPFRYRSYYYDVETKLYYLESRYYDPETGRFINADHLDYLGEGEDLTNYNLFVYCNNNPVMNFDPVGYLPFFIVTMLVGAAVGFGIAAAVDYFDDQRIDVEDNWKGYLGATLLGAAVGVAVGMAVSYSATGTATASFSDIRFGYALKAAQKGNYDRLAKLGTHNNRSREVGIGKYIEGSPDSYEALSKARKYTYYEQKPKHWERMESTLGKNTWEVNRAFLDQQRAKGKSFVQLSTTKSGSYLKELEHLRLL